MYHDPCVTQSVLDVFPSYLFLVVTGLAPPGGVVGPFVIGLAEDGVSVRLTSLLSLITSSSYILYLKHTV